jgi:Flp pilus assembly protein TadB
MQKELGSFHFRTMPVGKRFALCSGDGRIRTSNLRIKIGCLLLLLLFLLLRLLRLQLLLLSLLLLLLLRRRRRRRRRREQATDARRL